MSCVPNQPFLQTDPNIGGTFEAVADACANACPNSVLIRIGFSTRIRVFDGTGAGPFSEWSDYTFGTSGEWLGGAYTAFNSDPAQGGAEQQVRVKIEIDNTKGGPCVLRYRQIFEENTDTTPSYTVSTFGEVQTIEIPATEPTFTTDFYFLPCSVGQQSSMVGGPGGGGVDLGFGFERQAAYLRKKGFRQYTKDSPAVVIYRRESVISGGSLGCTPTIPPKIYNGTQSFDEVPPTPANQYVGDPAGEYNDNLSNDLRKDHYASTPYLEINKSLTFGEITFPGDTGNTRLMTEKFICRGDPKEKTLYTELVNVYETDTLKSAVEDALGLQLVNGVSGHVPKNTIVHRQWLCKQEVHYERVRTTKYAGNTGPFNTVLGGPGQTVVLTTITEYTKRKLVTGDVVGGFSLSNNTLIQADDANIIFGGRPSTEPDEPFPPLESPWENSENDDTEVVITSVKCKPNQLLCISIPTVEDPAVAALGYD